MCKPICWIIAAIVGVLVGVFSGLSTILAIILAVIVFLVLGWLLTKFICGEAEAAQPMRSAAPIPSQTAAAAPAANPAPEAAPAPASTPAAHDPAPAAEPEPAPAPEAPKAAAPSAAGGETHWASAVATDSGKAGAGRGQTGLKPSAELAEEGSLRDGVGGWKYESDAKPYRAVGDDRVSESPLEPAYTPKPGDVDYDGDGVIEGTNEGAKPATLSGPREGGADDLKKIKGVGPKMEAMLNGMGFYHYDQVAAWTAQEVAWVDANLQGFKGRVSRDNWVDQAKTLATGGETEFSKKVDKGGVY